LFLNWRDTGNPEGGGSEVYVEQMAAELVRRGARVTIVCAAHRNGPADEVNGDGVHIVRRGGRHTVYLRAAVLYLAGFVGLGRLARRHGGRPDVVVDVGNGVPFLSPLYVRRPVIALVHHVHREQWPCVLGRRGARFGWWLESRLAPWAYRRCRYITVSEATRGDLATIGVNPQSVTVVHNGTPAPRLTATVPANPTPALVVLGRLVPHKRVEIALRAVAALVEEFPTITLTVVGQGWWEPKLRELTTALGIDDHVEFAGLLTDDQKFRVLQSAWVALTPSLKEGWGLTIVEAGACGTPTVAFRAAGGVAESVVDGRSGVLVDNEEQFTGAVRDLLANASRRERMGAAAVRHAAGFTWEASGTAFADIVAQPRLVAVRAAAPLAKPAPVPTTD
jgi:glycosyltransferase involved in cell wall biosynthesis